MAPGIKDLRRQLRSERCPKEVLSRVHAEIARERGSRRLVYLGWATATALLLAFASPHIVRLSKQQSAGQVREGKLEQHRAVREQSQLALAFLGQTLKHAGSQSRDIILEVSLPRLRQGLRTASGVIPTSKPTETN